MENSKASPHYEAAVAALIGVAEYRQCVEFQAETLVDAAIPHLWAMFMEQHEKAAGTNRRGSRR